MLRYFYLLVCIQLCFSIDYTDHSDIDSSERRIRSKNKKFHKKLTRNPKKSHVVQFDVENFIRPPGEEAVNEDEPYSYRNKKRYNRRVSEKYYGDEASLIESTENTKPKKLVDYASIDENAAEVKTQRASVKDARGKHFNFHTLSFDEKANGKSGHEKTVNAAHKNIPIERVPVHPEAKCSFKGMKIPFFSYNKASTKSRHQKKRRMFCFNCHKTTTNPNQLEPNTDAKADDKDQIPNDKIEKREHKKVSKRAYEHLCPKCIKELLNKLKIKRNKKVNDTTTSPPKIPFNKELKPHIAPKENKPIIDKHDNLETNLQGDYYYLSNVRNKRDEQEESERDRRLKELEEVERKIDNVHVTSPTFTRVSLNIVN